MTTQGWELEPHSDQSRPRALTPPGCLHAQLPVRLLGPWFQWVHRGEGTKKKQLARLLTSLRPVAPHLPTPVQSGKRSPLSGTPGPKRPQSGLWLERGGPQCPPPSIPSLCHGPQAPLQPPGEAQAHPGLWTQGATALCAPHSLCPLDGHKPLTSGAGPEPWALGGATHWPWCCRRQSSLGGEPAPRHPPRPPPAPARPPPPAPPPASVSAGGPAAPAGQEG